VINVKTRVDRLCLSGLSNLPPTSRTLAAVSNYYIGNIINTFLLSTANLPLQMLQSPDYFVW
jgi:hypothetical protein